MLCWCAVWGFSAFCSSPWPSSGSLCLARGNPEVREQIKSCLEWEHSQTTDRRKMLGKVSLWLKDASWVRDYSPVTGKQCEWGDVSTLDSAKISVGHCWRHFSTPFSRIPSFRGFWGPLPLSSSQKRLWSQVTLGLILALPLKTEFLDTFLNHSELWFPHLLNDMGSHHLPYIECCVFII